MPLPNLLADHDLTAAVWAIGRRLLVTSLLGDVVPLLASLHRIFAIPAAAQALTSCPAWVPVLANGREAEVRAVCAC